MKKSAWTTPYLIGLTIVTIIAVLYGVSVHVGSLFGRFDGKKIELGGNQERVKESKKIDAGNVNEIDFDLSAANLTIMKGDELSVEYDMPTILVPEIEVEGTKLHISQKDNIKLGLGSMGEEFNIKIVVPDSITIDDMSIESDMGDIKLSELAIKNGLDIEIDMGNVELKNIECGSFNADCDMGNIIATDIKCDSIAADLDMGNLEISGLFNKADADCSMGNITIKSENEKAIVNANTDVGECKVLGI